MIKGCQKRFYRVKNPQSSIFEEAYFVLKNNISSEYAPGMKYVSDGEMAAEAERLVKDMCPAECSIASPKKSIASGKAGAFALGAVSSSAIIGTVALVLAFI